jgi:hypothetical protein
MSKAGQLASPSGDANYSSRSVALWFVRARPSYMAINYHSGAKSHLWLVAVCVQLSNRLDFDE